MKKRALIPAAGLMLVYALTLLPPEAAAQNCSSPPTGSYGSAWARQYQQWCVSCGGSFSMSGGNPSCTPGPNWGGRQSSAGKTYSGPGGYKGAILKGIQQGIQQGQQKAAEQMRQQQIENERANQTLLESGAALEKDAIEKARLIEEKNRVSALKSKKADAQRSEEIMSQMRWEPGAALRPQPVQDEAAVLMLKDLSSVPDPEKDSETKIESKSGDSGLVARSEQAEFDRMNEAWLRNQQELIRQSAEADKNWKNEVLASIREIRVPSPVFRPKAIEDLRPGDILLIGPDKSLTSQAILRADPFYRAVDYYFGGDVSKPELKKGLVSHAMTYVKTVKGEMLFLDHTGEGSRILNRVEFLKKYGSRGIYVARPQTKVDGRELWETARESALQEKSDYGVRGRNVVCSQRAAVAVARAANLPLQDERHVLSGVLPGIDITPNDFFDDKHAGKYFLISASPILPLKDSLPRK